MSTSGGTHSGAPTGAAGGDIAGTGTSTYPNPTLTALGAAAGPLGSATRSPVVTIDTKGRTTGLTDAAIALVASGDITGTLPGAMTLKNTGPGATGPIGDSSHVAAVTIDAQGRITALTSVAIVAGGGGNAIYGDGSDGARTFDGSTTILGMVPSGNIYTLTRDLFLASATINNGVTLAPAGFRIFCAGALVNNGTIQENGLNASGGTPGSGQTIGGSFNGSSRGRIGGTGGTGVGPNGANTTPSYGGTGGNGGAGGSAGGTGGTVAAPAATSGSLRMPIFAVLGSTIQNGGSYLNLQAGAGGGAGGGDGTHVGGGGGGGGGELILAAQTITGTGTISVNGGTGGNAAAGGTNSGGGGGGGGGWLVVVSSSIVAGAIAGQTVTAAGGAPGTKLGTGSDGATGGVGTVILLPN